MSDRLFPGLPGHNPTEKNDANMDILWQPARDGARILRVFGNGLAVRVPDRIGGLPVTEIGAYCFSASEHIPSEGVSLTRLITKETLSAREDSPGREEPLTREQTLWAAGFPAVCGDYLQEVCLPDSVTTLHNAAFYNCRNLSLLSVGSRLSAIGSDVFMNCRSLDRIHLRSSCREANGLYLILERLITEVEVSFLPADATDARVGPDDGPESANPECVLLFPEYWEWLNEISPAHVFSRSIEGEGFRMRRVFQDHRIDFSKYDQCFPEVIKGESAATLCRIALNRLRWPVSLQPRAEELYFQTIKDRLDTAIRLIIKTRDMAGLHFLCSRFLPDKGLLLSWMKECTEADWGEGKAFLMEEFHRQYSFKKKTFILEDL